MSDWIPLNDYRLLPAVPGVYVIRHRESGREYVGLSVNVRKRVQAHRRIPDWDLPLYRAFRKYGVDSFEVCLYLTGTRDELKELEILLIDERQTYGKGYNATRGGDGIQAESWSLEARRAMAEKKRGSKPTTETKEKLRRAAIANNPGRGRTKSPEMIARISATVTQQYASGRVQVISEVTRLRMSAAQKGKIKPKQTESANFKRSLALRGRTRADVSARAQAVLVWELNALLPKEFATAVEAAEYYGCHPAHLRQWAAGNVKPKSGFIFTYA